MNKRTSMLSLCAALLIAAAGRSAAENHDGNAISDSWITSKTKMSLAADDRVKGRQVSVETKKGQVRLSGKVDTEEAKLAAEQIAAGIDGASGVKNQLRVVAPANREAVDEQDEAITSRVKKNFAKDRTLSKTDIGVTTNAGVVSLTGEAPDFTTSAKASWTAWQTDGVKSVRNDITQK